ncbi:hypothetical protein HK103_001357 [Boothiomyces macroporosus]|uniref:Uncharacterized protein n=1 Tax=Boothiomyces macroporosus TaxID=261099 RepID=A0AAD5Y0Y7_9FUNG|nr:hypothetical protein HK103_001357 [Boothiomyces macroporosus]
MNKTHQKIIIFESASDDFTATVKERASGVPFPPPPPKISIQPNIYRAIPHPPPPPLFSPSAPKAPKSPKNIPSPPAPPQIFKNPAILQLHQHIPDPPSPRAPPKPRIPTNIPPAPAPPKIPVDVSPQMNIKFHIPTPPPPPAPTPPKMSTYNCAVRDITSHIPDAPPLPNSTAKRTDEHYNEELERYGKTVEKYAKRMEKYQSKMQSMIKQHQEHQTRLEKLDEMAIHEYKDGDVKAIESSETDKHSKSH